MDFLVMYIKNDIYQMPPHLFFKKKKNRFRLTRDGFLTVLTFWVVHGFAVLSEREGIL